MMKFILRCLLAALAISATSASAAQQPAAGLLVYESVANYVEVFEFASITRKNLFDSTVIRPTGQSLSCKTEYIRAVVNYPPLFISPENAAAASDNIRNIESLQERYPKFKGQLQAVEDKWNTALEAGKQIKISAVSQNPSPKAESLSFTTTTGKKFENVTLSGTSGTDISVVSDSGIAHIPFEQLPKDMQARLHYVPQAVISQALRDKEALAQALREKEAKAQQDKEALAQAQRDKDGQALRDKEDPAQRAKDAQAQKDKEVETQRDKDRLIHRAKELFGYDKSDNELIQLMAETIDGFYGMEPSKAAALLSKIQSTARALDISNEYMTRHIIKYNQMAKARDLGGSGGMNTESAIRIMIDAKALQEVEQRQRRGY